MKRRHSTVFWLFLLAVSQISASPLSLKLWGGGGWLGGGDLNKSIQGWKDFLQEKNKPPYSIHCQVDEIHLFPELGAEASYNISARLQLGIGFSLFSGKSRGEISSSLNQTTHYVRSSKEYGSIQANEESSRRPEINLQVIPVTLSFHYTVPISSSLGFFILCGAGFYFGQFDSSEKYEYTFNSTDENHVGSTISRFMEQYATSGKYSETAKSRALGLHGGAGLEIKVRRSLGFVLEVLARWARLGEWKGQKSDSYEWSYIWGYSGGSSENGKKQESSEGQLWLVDAKSSASGKSYPRLVFSQEKPVSSFYENVKSAVIDLSGFSLRLGLKLSF